MVGPTTQLDEAPLTTLVDGSPASVAPMRRFPLWPAVVIGVWAVLLVLAGEPSTLLARHWPLIFLGFAGAVIGNATAVGGGMVFIPAALFVYHFPPLVALQLALGTQSIGMTSGAFAWVRRGVVPLSALRVAVPGLLLGSVLSTLVVRPNGMLIKGAFGPVSIVVGLLMLFLLDRRGQRSDIPARARLPLAAVAFLGGTLTGWVAVGEGEVVAAFLMLAYGLRADRGIGLGVVLLSINSIFLVLLHHFVYGGVPWSMILFTGLGAVFGAQLGPRVGQWVGPRRLKIGFAAVAIADGCLFLFQGLRALH
ncbi:MAG: sulfite exporter TauE/SafE family protein [Deltaproteobacteria bacterium]|nr:sulfite exporter TauE/SafE family protein [Deltaproteobacteria bacterium]